mmetsp:Transcript_37989/g.63874  ORF Transcript_37989/g.63874 Transcript_37989/m.63874 type:complete len:478 (+) Transcript_37989:188-1621(+)|eukprot:CAMPEP_0198212700 /NCGR_PEP_ID=MMETSP1445-20131203/27273_1 /TAXON_ID=36898 /ORGANISM="Pyramimonas sp., Strain CCMP2087" /LENGTH=477 /DNA_ID=CAMNT_0043887219 /DNA_START=178 /DNA_END=1611 /DNA_ORIENTATION=+
MSGSLYHLVPKTTWIKSKLFGQPYFPPTYDADGFIHLTKDPKLLLPVANHFYSDVPGDFLVLCIDSTKLTSEVKFEPAADVGDKPNEGLMDDKEPVLFPHLYGTIDHISVFKELAVTRQKLVDGGKFLSIAGIGENENDLDNLESQMSAAKDAADAAAKLKADTAMAKEEAERERAETMRIDAEKSYEDTRSKIEAEAAEFMFARAAEAAKEQEEMDSKRLKEQQQAEQTRLQEQEILESARRAAEEEAKLDESHMVEEDVQALMAAAAVRAEEEAKQEEKIRMDAKAETEAKAAVDKVRTDAEAVVKAERRAAEAKDEEMAMLELLEQQDRDAKERAAKAEKDAQERKDKEYTRKKEEEEERAEKARRELEEKSYPTLREYKQIETPPLEKSISPSLATPSANRPPKPPSPRGEMSKDELRKPKEVTKSGLSIDDIMSRKSSFKVPTKTMSEPPADPGWFGWLNAWCLFPTAGGEL